MRRCILFGSVDGLAFPLFRFERITDIVHSGAVRSDAKESSYERFFRRDERRGDVRTGSDMERVESRKGKECVRDTRERREGRRWGWNGYGKGRGGDREARETRKRERDAREEEGRRRRKRRRRSRTKRMRCGEV